MLGWIFIKAAAGIYLNHSSMATPTFCHGTIDLSLGTSLTPYLAKRHLQCVCHIQLIPAIFTGAVPNMATWQCKISELIVHS